MVERQEEGSFEKKERQEGGIRLETLNVETLTGKLELVDMVEEDRWISCVFKRSDGKRAKLIDWKQLQDVVPRSVSY